MHTFEVSIYEAAISRRGRKVGCTRGIPLHSWHGSSTLLAMTGMNCNFRNKGRLPKRVKEE